MTVYAFLLRSFSSAVSRAALPSHQPSFGSSKWLSAHLFIEPSSIAGRTGHDGLR